ncbi:TIGR04222 domain-containing membrane protein [Geodermatophilus sp. URMC 61]|uniref:TIGR04222 domain-containing membrane protein n=1 Tax=Geodermatophilus sp. URMC 61 TaxID=3423411 RepID=UPI00406CAD7A
MPASACGRSPSRSSTRRTTDMTGTHVPLLGSDLYEVAYLVGGPRRAVEAAVVALVVDGRLRADPATGELRTVDPRRRHPVEAAVLDATGPRSRRSIEGVAWRVRTDVRLAALADGLRQAGLVSRRGGVDATAERTWTAVGLTRAGRRELRRLRSDPAVVGTSEALAVALVGPGAWADAERRAAVFAPPRPYLPTTTGPSVREVRRTHHPVYTDGGSAAAWAGGFGGDCGAGGGDGGGGC